MSNVFKAFPNKMVELSVFKHYGSCFAARCIFFPIYLSCLRRLAIWYHTNLIVSQKKKMSARGTIQARLSVLFLFSLFTLLDHGMCNACTAYLGAFLWRSLRHSWASSSSLIVSVPGALMAQWESACLPPIWVCRWFSPCSEGFSTGTPVFLLLSKNLYEI